MTPERFADLRKTAAYFLEEYALPELDEALDEIERLEKELTAERAGTANVVISWNERFEQLQRDLQQKEEAVEYWIQRACANETDANGLADKLRRLQRERDALLKEHEAVHRHYEDGDVDHPMIRCPLLRDAHNEAARVLAEGKEKT